MVPSSLRYADDEIDILRRQTLLISRQEQSQSTPPRGLDEMFDVVSAFLVSRWGVEHADLAGLAAGAVTLTAWKATVQWARSTDCDPSPRLERALVALRAGFEPPNSDTA